MAEPIPPPGRFVVGFADADPSAVAELGGKGAGLAEMTRHGLPVPPGFVITTEACRHVLTHGTAPDGLAQEVEEHLRALEEQTGKTFGRGANPLLLSVRSGAPISMPGMMDTILDLGLNRAAAAGLGELTGDARFVADLARRFCSMYGQTVLGLLAEPEGVAELVASFDADVSPAMAFDAVWSACEAAVRRDTGDAVPTEPEQQLQQAIEAVFRSWNTRRARTYREHHRIPHSMGTAVVVQSMVFGNLGPRSGSGVAFTRNPVDGEPALFGEFLYGGQGEDVVSGSFTPEPIQAAARRMPAPFAELERLARELEARRGDVLDIEFTIEDERLYFLQVRSAKRTAQAAVRIADDLWTEGTAAPGQALAGVTAEHVRQVLRPAFDPDAVAGARTAGRLLTTGIGACPGQVTGQLYFDSDTAKARADEGVDVILARPVTSPADLHGMIAARGIVTAVGGSTSHAAVVARALGTACVVGCDAAHIDPDAGTLRVGEVVLRPGDPVSLDGSSGDLFSGTIETGSTAGRTEAFSRLIRRCSDVSGCEVWGRVTLPQQVDRVRDVGAYGIVLAIDDVLAASGHLDELVAELGRAEESPARLEAISALVAERLTPVFEAAGDLPAAVRLLDVLADEAREYLRQTPLLTARPELTLPLGVPALLEAQCLGVARAVELSGRAAATTIAVRHVSGTGEAAALADLGERVAERHPDADVRVGIYATSPAALTRASDLRKHAAIHWIELKQLQALHLGLRPSLLLTREPLDSYLDAGLLPLDPRAQLDPAVATLLGGATEAGIRLSMRATEELIADVHRVGFRRYAVEADEVPPTLLCLGKAALAS